MYFVYFLYSQKTENVYVGCTNNLDRRPKQHQKGLVKSTKTRRPLFLIQKEVYSSLYLARKREDYLKSLYGYRERQKILRNYLKDE
ncbi:MAG: GIY-YIG nuclease family protein [Candidatus Pacebacteria bacterium]|nr:GIY-YIG nuclease family protein [Candidatus Paceibacterota bacterium]